MAKEAKLNFYLVVIYPFNDYQRGNAIFDPVEIEKILNSQQADNVNKVLKD